MGTVVGRALLSLLITLSVGSTAGAVVVFVVALTGSRSVPSATTDPASWIASIGLAVVGAFVGGLTGALVGLVAWALTAPMFAVFKAWRRPKPVQGLIAAIGGTLATAGVLAIFVLSGNVTMGVPAIVGLCALAAALAVAVSFCVGAPSAARR